MKALLVDDEKPARDRLRRLLEKNTDIEIIGEASNGLEALELLEKTQPDLMFLDIEMPELNGFGVAEALLRKPGASPWIVFVTAFSDFALKAFEVHAIDYLVKPVHEARLISTFEKIKKNSARGSLTSEILSNFPKEKKFALKIGAKYMICDPAKISAILATNHYSTLIYEGKELLCDDSLESLHERFDPQTFVRVHRSAIVNVGFVKFLERQGDRKYVAALADSVNTKVPISRDKLDEIKELFRK